MSQQLPGTRQHFLKHTWQVTPFEDPSMASHCSQKEHPHPLEGTAGPRAWPLLPLSASSGTLSSLFSPAFSELLHRLVSLAKMLHTPLCPDISYSSSWS